MQRLLHRNIGSGCSIEPSRRDCTFQHSIHMFEPTRWVKISFIHADRLFIQTSDYSV